jgi:hypothetical protein
MSDSPLGSGGAKCVAELLYLCEGLKEIHLSSCEIKDAGAKNLFELLK